MLFLAGCGDPESSRLAVGAKVLAIPHKGSDQEKADDHVFLQDSSARSIYPELSAGTHLIVVDDSADPGRDRPTRDVRVHVEDGEHRGLAGVVVRWELRPE